MRLPLYTLFLSFSALVSVVHSIHPHALIRRDNRQSPAPNALTSRQHRVTRDLLDLCINANVDLAANLSPLLGALLGPADALAKVQLCLCLKDLDIYLETNDQVQALVGLLGKDTVGALITALINTSPASKKCTLPPHAHHTCNNSDPCHYECDPNYVREGDICVCAPPNTTCNGVCGSFPHGCGSSVPLKKRAELVRTLAQAKATCKPHESVCGIPGRVGGFAFECIDVSRTKDSCGGCIVPHPFVEGERDLHPVGKDCGKISKVRTSTCSASQCIVRSCEGGWMPSANKEECIPSSSGSRMVRMRSRSFPSVLNATVDVNIDSGLISQLVGIVNNVLDLGALSQTMAPHSVPPSSSSSSTFSTIPTIYSLFDDIDRATGNLLTSPTVSALLSNIGKLLDTSALLNSMLSGCGCIRSLGLTDASGLLSNLMASLIATQNWCTHNTIVPGVAIPNPGTSKQPIIIGLTDLLSELGLYGKSGASVGGLGSGLTDSANQLLNGVNLGPNNYRRSDGILDTNLNATIYSELLAEISALVDLVVRLRLDAASLPISSATAALPLPSDPTSTVNVNGLVNSILVAVGNLLNASTSSTFVSSVDGLVQTVEGVNTLLSQSSYVDQLGLSPLVADLAQIVPATLHVQTLCREYPIGAPPSSPAPPATLPSSASPSAASAPVSPKPVSSDDSAIVVGLSDLLTSLRLLGPVDAVVTVAGLGPGLNQPVNNLLNGLGIGPENARRGADSSDVTAAIAINSELRSQLEGLADLVIDLEFTMSSLPSTVTETSNSLSANSVLGVARALGQLLQSKTVATFLANIDAFISAEKDLEKRFDSCGCMEALQLDQAYGLLQLIGQAAAGLKVWSTSHSIVAPTPANPSQTLGPLLPTGGSLAKPAASSYPTASTSSTLPGEDIPIVIGLDHLLDALGLGSGVVTVDGLLGDSLDTAVNDVTNGLGIGPDGVRRRGFSARRLAGTGKLQDLRRTRRQIALNATVDSDLLLQVDALVDLVVGLNSAATSLPPAPSSTPASGVAYPTLVPSASSLPSVGSTLPIDSGLVNSIVDAVVSLLSSKTYEEFVSKIDALVSASSQSLDALKGCGCIGDLGLDSLVGNLLQIVGAALGLQDYCHSHTAPPHDSSPPHGTPTVPLPSPGSPSVTGPSSSNPTNPGSDEPLVVGLTKLLNGLGLDIKADVVVDLLGNDLNHSLNTLLDGLEIGPNGARRRFVRRSDRS